MRDNVTSYGLTDGLTKVWEAHMLKFGADIHFDRYVQQRAVGNFSGNFDFGANASNPLNTNYGYSNALLGDFNAYTEPNARPDYDPHTRIFEWYGQDSWKAAKNLTLDYGMRFTWAMPQTLHIGANFVPSIYDANQKPVLYVPVNVVQGGKTVKMAKDPTTGTLVSYAYVGAIVPGVGNQFDGLVSTPNALTQGQGMLFAPRIGFAWDVNGDGKTAIRGGSGIFYNARPRSGQEGDMTTNPPNVQNPVQNWSSIATLFSAPNAVFPTNLNRALQVTGKTPVMYNSSLGIQRAVGFGTVIDVAYVGTIGRHLGQSVDLNALAPGARFISAAANQDPTNPGKSLADNFLRPYPGLGSIPYLNFESNSSYHSLQAQITHRFSRGVEFGVAYTWSKAMDYTDDYNGTVAKSAPMRAYSYGLAGFDRTHNLTVNWLHDLPKGSRLLNVPIVRGVFDNWQLSGIASFVSGAPTGIAVTSTAGVDFTGGGDGVRAQIVGNPILDKGTRNVLQFFNTAAIAMPTPNTATSISGFVGNAGKNVFRGPGSQNWDVSLLKNIPIKDRISFQLRCEAYNLFNHPNFTTVDTAAKFNAAGAQTNTTFGQVTAASAARSLQLAGRITF